MKIEQIMLTPEKARELLDSQERNRSMRPAIVDGLCDTIINGAWRLNNDMISVNTEGALINGQHRCQAVISTGISVPVILAVGFEPDDVYAMDTLLAKRGMSDILEFNDVKQSRNVAALLNTLRMYVDIVFVRGHITSYYSPESLMAEYRKHPMIDESMLFVDRLAKMGLTGLLPRAISHFCHYAFSQVNHSEADQFMESLWLGSFLGVDDVVLQLRNRLINNMASLRKLNRTAVLALLIKTWNITQLGQKKNLMWNPRKESFPIIYGNPFDGMYSPEKPFGHVE